jgi:hypothetical protein
MQHLYKIKNKDGELVTFKFNEAQRRYLAWRKSHRYNKIIKPRQKGFTTLHCIDLLDDALWEPGASCAIIAHERSAVVGIFEIVKRAFDNLPEELKPKTKYDNKNELQFIEDFTGRKLDSKIYVALKLRSGTVTVLHISEAAYIKNRTELNAGSKQAVGKTGSITEETTGNGFNEFYDEVESAIESEGKEDGIPAEFKDRVFFYPWFADNEYELETDGIDDYTDDEIELKEKYGLSDRKLAWRRWKLRELGKSEKTKSGLTPLQLFKQEYPASLMEAFQASGKTYFDQEKVENINAIPFARVADNGLGIWVEPQIGHTYVVGVDPSNGVGLDAASVNVWDVSPTLERYRQVAQFHGYMDPYDLGDYSADVATMYNRALLSIENNLLTTVLRANKVYDRVFKTVKIDKKTEQPTQTLGFSTNTKTRPVMMDNFRKLFNEDLLEINSSVSKSEMRTLIVKENKKVEHAEGKNDDSLFADFIAIETRSAVPAEPEVYNAGLLR